MDNEIIKVYRLHIELESEHDWNELRGIIEEWEYGGILEYDGADSAFSVKADIDARTVVRSELLDEYRNKLDK